MAQEIQTSHYSISFIHFLNAEEEPGRGDEWALAEA